MRGGRNLTEAAAAIEYFPATFAAPIDLQALFSRAGDAIEVDLGCGDGSFLAAQAQQKSDRNFVGIEQMPGRVRASCRRIDSLELTNARLIRCEIAAAVRYLLPAESVDFFHLMFPDPWPKRRHHRRRVFTRELLHSLTVALKPGGLLHVATDQTDYFAEMRQTLTGGDETFREVSVATLDNLPRSAFEERFVLAGEQIHRLVLRKVSG